jgi:SulP family sulfate permease
MSGLLTACYGPIMGGLFGGSDYNILGPAGALVNVLNKLSFENGPEILPFIAIGTGIVSLIVYFLKIEVFCTIIPNSVLEGFTASVALTIGFGQLNFALGLVNPKPSSEFYLN